MLDNIKNDAELIQKDELFATLIPDEDMCKLISIRRRNRANR